MNAGTTARRATADDGLWSPGRRALTIGLVLNVTIVASEALAVGTILPIVAKDLGGIDLYGWVFSGFFLGNLLGIVVAGMLIDRGGLASPFLMGIGLFSVGLLVGGLAPTMGVLVVARVIQGFGAAAIPAVAYVSIARAMPERLRPRMFATLSTAWILPGVIGPVAASAVTGLWNWRIVFLGLLPLIAIAASLTLPAIRAVAPASTTGTAGSAGSAAKLRADRRRLPLAVVLVAGAGLVVSGLSNFSTIPIVLIAVGVAIGVPAFAGLTPRGTIRASTGLPTAILLRGFLTFAFFCADAYVALVIQGWRGESALIAGLTYMASTLTWTGGSWINAHNIARLGPGRLLRAGFGVVLVGIVGFLVVLLPWVPPATGIVIWGIAGFGMGLAYSTPSLIVLREAAVADQGAATAGLQLSDVLGASLGTGIGGALIAFGLRAGSPGWEGLAATFVVAAVFALIGLALTARLGARTAAGLPPEHLEPTTTRAHSGGGATRGCGRLAARPRHPNPTGRPPSWRNPRPMSAEELRAKIREIPDFPKPGILFYDITTLLKDRVAYKEAIDLMIEPYKGEQIDIVVGMESRGFIFSAAMAYQIGAGLVPVRKLGKLPAETITVEYALEYGSNTLEIHRDAIEPGQKVLIVDDLLATGGTVKGTIELIERLKGNVVGLAFLVELDFLKGRDRLDGRRVTSVIKY